MKQKKVVDIIKVGRKGLLGKIVRKDIMTPNAEILKVTLY